MLTCYLTVAIKLAKTLVHMLQCIAIQKYLLSNDAEIISGNLNETENKKNIRNPLKGYIS